jgi:hypothetical protein
MSLLADEEEKVGGRDLRTSRSVAEKERRSLRFVRGSRVTLSCNEMRCCDGRLYLLMIRARSERVNFARTLLFAIPA